MLYCNSKCSVTVCSQHAVIVAGVMFTWSSAWFIVLTRVKSELEAQQIELFMSLFQNYVFQFSAQITQLREVSYG